MKLKILSNPRKDWAAELASEVKAFLTANGHGIVDGGADATVCIGGDGTILYAHHQRAVEGPVLGIGTRKSYICQLEDTSWKGRILSALSGKTITVMTIKADIGGKHFHALNDFVLHAKDYRVMNISIAHDDKNASFRGDGIIVSTSLGSTSYAYSAGGEELSPEERKISIVPICPYRRAFQPVMVSEDSRISILAEEAYAFITDGIFVSELAEKQKVNIQKGDDILFFEGVGYDK